MRIFTNYLSLVILINFLLISEIFAQNEFSESGIFLDTLKVPGIELRMAITINRDEDTFKASFNSIDQGSGEIPFDQVTIEENHILLVSNIGIQVEGDFNKEKTEIKGEFRQGPGKFPLEFKRIPYLPIYKRPQEPKRPFPYQEEQVVYNNENAGIKLSGTLTIPKGEGPFPAVVLLSGSGPQNRNEEIFGHKPFMVIADYLTRNGIAVLRSDDRGVGGSTGDFKNSTTGDFAEDALCAVQFLKSNKDIISNKIGLIGHSEGGMMAPIAASKSDDIAFIVLLAGPGSNLGDNVIFQRSLKAKKAGASEEFIKAQEKGLKKINEIGRREIAEDNVREEIKEMYENLDQTTKDFLNWNKERLNMEADIVLGKWWRFGIRYDPHSAITSLTCPVLALLGEKDRQVPPMINEKELISALESGHPKSKVRVIPNVNHLFQNCETGDETEYLKIEETISPEVLEIINSWIGGL